MAKLTLDTIKRLAPDSKSMSAAKAVADPRKWAALGIDGDGVLWGEYDGSDRYSLYVSSSAPATTSGCSCPSRKRPCKHVIGLLLMAAGGHPVPTKAVPEAVREAADNAFYESTWE
jgi:hypothetical protein